MAHSRANVLIHLVWGTKNRRPWIDASVENVIRDAIAVQCVRLESPLLAFGAADDHAHWVVSLARKHAVMTFARAAKSYASVMVNRKVTKGFGWQRGYGAFSISERDPDGVLSYVRDQRTRHATNRIEPVWEEWSADDDDV